MLVGFIHGVMNTDNMALSGETIDYGPCAFMDHYDPRTVFSSIDHAGRYAYTNQPAIAQWNLARLAETLLPLIDPDAQKAVGVATEIVAGFTDRFDSAFLAGMRRKVGISSALDGDAELIKNLLSTMQQSRADFTLTFRALTLVAHDSTERLRLRELFAADSAIDSWLEDWQNGWRKIRKTNAERLVSMRAANLTFIPRNHRVDFALRAAENGDYSPFHKLLGVLQRPYDDQPDAAEYALPPEPSEQVLQTFCGT